MAVLAATFSLNTSYAQDEYQNRLAEMSNTRFLIAFAADLGQLCVKGTNHASVAECAQAQVMFKDAEREYAKREANYKFPSLFHSSDKDKLPTYNRDDVYDEDGNVRQIPGYAGTPI